jgi:nickel superoxide dismutase
MFWKATKLAGEAKNASDPKVGQQLLDAIAEIEKVFWDTKTE